MLPRMHEWAEVKGIDLKKNRQQQALRAESSIFELSEKDDATYGRI